LKKMFTEIRKHVRGLREAKCFDGRDNKSSLGFIKSCFLLQQMSETKVL
jgi:hypothetical protein